MLCECIISGFGGQGVMSMGQMLSYAGMKKGYQVVWLPSYGPEMRGGTAYCTVILSDSFIASPLVMNPAYQVVMNRPSLDKFGPKVAPKGKLFINSSLIDVKSDRDDISQFLIPANEISMNNNSNRSANIAMLGAFVAQLDMLTLEDIQVMLQEKFAAKPKVVEINMGILQAGYDAAMAL